MRFSSGLLGLQLRKKEVAAAVGWCCAHNLRGAALQKDKIVVCYVFNSSYHLFQISQ